MVSELPVHHFDAADENQESACISLQTLQVVRTCPTKVKEETLFLRSEGKERGGVFLKKLKPSIFILAFWYGVVNLMELHNVWPCSRT